MKWLFIFSLCLWQHNLFHICYCIFFIKPFIKLWKADFSCFPPEFYSQEGWMCCSEYMWIKCVVKIKDCPCKPPSRAEWTTCVAAVLLPLLRAAPTEVSVVGPAKSKKTLMDFRESPGVEKIRESMFRGRLCYNIYSICERRGRHYLYFAEKETGNKTRCPQAAESSGVCRVHTRMWE